METLSLKNQQKPAPLGAAVAAATAAATAKSDGEMKKVSKPKTSMRLKAKKYDIVDPTTQQRIPSNHSVRVENISGWMRSQIKAGLVEEVED